MKKFTFNYDKKIKTYIIIYWAATILGIIISSIQFNTVNRISYGMLNSMQGFIIIFSILSLILFYNFFKAVTSKNTIADIYLKYGTFGLRKVYFYSISSIEFNNDIILECDTKKIKIKVFNLDENKEKYAEILTAINENTNLDFSVDEALEKLDYYQNFKFLRKGESLRLNSWIFIIFVNFIIFSVLLGIYGLIILISAAVSFNFLLLLFDLIPAAALFITIIIAVFMTQKRRKVVIYLKRVMTFSIVIVSISILYAGVTNLISSMWFSALSSVMSIVIQLNFYLIIIRYLNVSKRVANTFVYEKGQPIIYADRDVDPGFKLFKNEPSSIYAIVSWIVMPVIAVIMIIFLFANTFSKYF